MDHFDDPTGSSNENWHIAGYPSIAEEIRRRCAGACDSRSASSPGTSASRWPRFATGNMADRRPTGCAYVLLQVIRENPRARAAGRAQGARTKSPESVAPIKPAKSMRAPPGMRRPV